MIRIQKMDDIPGLAQNPLLLWLELDDLASPAIVARDAGRATVRERADLSELILMPYFILLRHVTSLFHFQGFAFPTSSSQHHNPLGVKKRCADFLGAPRSVNDLRDYLASMAVRSSCSFCVELPTSSSPIPAPLR